jgi:tetratricopeptide (TPR) repeat protein
MTPRSWRRWLVLIWALALCVRAVCLAELRDSPLLSVLVGDGREYDAWAMRIAGGDWLGGEVFYQSPLYPYLLGVLYAAAGHSLMAVRALQCLLGTASCVLLALAGRRFAGEKAGVAAGLLLAACGPAVFFDVVIQKSSVDVFLVTLLLASSGAFLERRHWAWLAGAGVAAGALTLNRENARVLLPVVVAWLAIGVRPASLRTRAAWIATFALAVSLVVIPVGLRNRAIGGEFLISTSQMGPNLYIGNHAGATGSYQALVPGRANASFEREDATRLAQDAMGRPLTPGEVSDYWTGQALAFVREEPAAWMALTGRKLLLTINAAEVFDSESIEAYAEESVVLRGLRWIDFGVLLALAMVGVCVTRDRWPAIGLVAASAVALACSLAVFYVFARYRYPMVPFVLVFAGAGLARLTTRPVFDGRAVRTGLALAACAFAVTRVSIPVGGDATLVNVGAALLSAGRTTEALRYLEAGVAKLPDYGPAWCSLGIARGRAGDLPGAIRDLETAVRVSPDDYDSHATLATFLQRRGDAAGALQHFGEAVRLRPDVSEAHWNLGLARLKAGDAAAAREAFLEVLRLQPETFSVRMGLGTASDEAGRHDEAVDHFTRAVALSPRSVEALCALARSLAALGRLPEAETQLETAMDLARASGDRAAVPQIEAALRACRAQTARRPAAPGR